MGRHWRLLKSADGAAPPNCSTRAPQSPSNVATQLPSSYAHLLEICLCHPARLAAALLALLAHLGGQLAQGLAGLQALAGDGHLLLQQLVVLLQQLVGLPAQR